MCIYKLSAYYMLKHSTVAHTACRPKFLFYCVNAFPPTKSPKKTKEANSEELIVTLYSVTKIQFEYF